MNRTSVLALSLCVALVLLASLTSQMTFSLASQPQVSATAKSLSVEQAMRAEPSTDLSNTVTMVFIGSGWDTTQVALAEQIADQLTQEISVPVHSLIVACPWAAAEALARGEADVGWLPATLYVQAHDQFGVDARLVLKRFGATAYRGEFLVRSDSGIKTLADLAGKNFIFTHPQSTSGFLLPAYHISKTQGVIYTAFFSQTMFGDGHRNAVEAVYLGKFQGTPVHGGATFEDGRNIIAGDYPDVFTTLKVIAYTDYVNNDTVAVRPGMNPLLAQQVISGLQQLAGTPAGLDPMQQLFGIEDLAPTTDSAYDSVRQLVAAFDLKDDPCSQDFPISSAAGGTAFHVDVNELSTEVVVPGGAVTKTVQLGMTSIPAATHLPNGLTDIGRVINISPVFSGTEQVVTAITGTYTITFGYNEGGLGTVDENGLGIFWWDGSQWEREPSSQVNGALDTISATPDHFSIFAVLGLKERLYLPALQKP